MEETNVVLLQGFLQLFQYNVEYVASEKTFLISHQNKEVTEASVMEELDVILSANPEVKSDLTANGIKFQWQSNNDPEL